MPPPDELILNVALPSIKSDLGFTQQRLRWVVDGYIQSAAFADDDPDSVLEIAA